MCKDYIHVIKEVRSLIKRKKYLQTKVVDKRFVESVEVT